MINTKKPCTVRFKFVNIHCNSCRTPVIFSLRDRRRIQCDYRGLEPGGRQHFVSGAGLYDGPGGRCDRQVTGELGQPCRDRPIRYTRDRPQSRSTRCRGMCRRIQPRENWASYRWAVSRGVAVAKIAYVVTRDVFREGRGGHKGPRAVKF